MSATVVSQPHRAALGAADALTSASYPVAVFSLKPLMGPGCESKVCAQSSGPHGPHHLN